MRPGGSGANQPDEVEGADIRWARGGVRLAISAGSDGTSIEVGFRSRGAPVSIDVLVDPARDSLNVVVPWSERRFQFTSKHVGRRARGTLRIGAEEHEFDGHAALDQGRGRWPARTRWNWGAAAGDGIALQLGAQWTDGTGLTENGVFVDGHLHKISEELRFVPSGSDPLAPWRIESPGSDRVVLCFQPCVDRPHWVPGLARLRFCMGHYTGRIGLDGGAIEVRDLLGWAEEMDVLW